MQLERRVRELRETRGAYSATQNLRERSVVDPVLSYSDDFIDPLGLGCVTLFQCTISSKCSCSELFYWLYQLIQILGCSFRQKI